MEPSSSSNVQQAFGVLQDAVNDLSGKGRRALGATLKPDLVRRTYGGFDERALGFTSFGDFVRKARDAGFVDMHQAPNSPDFEVVPVGTEPAPPQPSERASHARSHGAFIRQDLWKAFVDWDESLVRLYDTKTRRASLFPREPAPLEPAGYTAARNAWSTDADRYREIQPISRDTQITWMRDFAATLGESPQKTILDYALTTDRAVRDFGQAIRQYPDVARRWQAFRKEQVATAIAAWMQEAGVELSLYELADNDPPAAEQARKPLEGSADVQRIRARVHQAVDRMSAADLLRLSLPVEYLIEN